MPFVANTWPSLQACFDWVWVYGSHGSPWPEVVRCGADDHNANAPANQPPHQRRVVGFRLWCGRGVSSVGSQAGWGGLPRDLACARPVSVRVFLARTIDEGCNLCQVQGVFAELNVCLFAEIKSPSSVESTL